MAETVLNYWKRKCYAEVLVFIGIIMGYFNHPLWELIFSILGNSGRSPGAHWRTSYLDKADIPCPRTCPGEDDAFIYRRPVCSMELKRICFGKRWNRIGCHEHQWSGKIMAVSLSGIWVQRKQCMLCGTGRLKNTRCNSGKKCLVKVIHWCSDKINKSFFENFFIT